MENFLKKSAPKIGCATLATRKECLAEKPGNCKVKDLVPKVSMVEPLAALRRWPGRGMGALLLLSLIIKDNGITEMSAPLSTRKEHLEVASKTDIDPDDEVLSETMPGVIDARLWRFPDPDVEEQ